jgi:hypothetical protein
MRNGDHSQVVQDCITSVNSNMMVNILRPVALEHIRGRVFTVMSRLATRQSKRKGGIVFWMDFASYAALPVTLFLLFGMQPFLDFLGARAAAKHKHDRVAGAQWARTKRG